MQPKVLRTLATAELKSTRCWCGKPKESMETFCTDCYWTLPIHMRGGLYRHLGDGYMEAYGRAVTYLWTLGIDNVPATMGQFTRESMFMVIASETCECGERKPAYGLLCSSCTEKLGLMIGRDLSRCADNLLDVYRIALWHIHTRKPE